MIRHLKLHHFPASRSARVKWALHEVVGDAFELERVPLYERYANLTVPCGGDDHEQTVALAVQQLTSGGFRP